MKKILHKASERIVNDFGWLRIQASFRNDAAREDQKRFGKLVILDDALMIPGGRGFQMHPHDNMEIISWVMSGTDEHNDNKNGIRLLQCGDVQLMSAGTGIEHAENNHSIREAVHMLQIWIEPQQLDIAPKYQVTSLNDIGTLNVLSTFISPDGSNNSLKINQQAYLSIVTLEPARALTYKARQPGNGVYIFMLLGNVTVENTTLGDRDALGIWEFEMVEVKATNLSNILFIEVPMG
jgi:redox-sensitive bicupin YhaK (pirin superfamily)